MIKSRKIVYFAPTDIREMHSSKFNGVSKFQTRFLCNRAARYFTKIMGEYRVVDVAEAANKMLTASAFLIRCLANKMGVPFDDIYVGGNSLMLSESFGFLGLLNTVGNQYMKDNYGFFLSFNDNPQVPSIKEFHDEHFQVRMWYGNSAIGFDRLRSDFIDEMISNYIPEDDVGFQCVFEVEIDV